MKLSMWMIANRLESFDMELDIEENAPVVLKSARLAHATNCVYIYPEDEGIVCQGEGGIIRIQNISIAQGFEIVQSVFDYFEDWSEQVSQNIRKRDYQEVVNLAVRVFNNPVVLFDGNSRVLGISRQYPEDSLDEEWTYLMKYGYSSLKAMEQFKYSNDVMKFYHQGFESYQAPDFSYVQYGGLTYCMYCNNVVCGRLNLLSKERPLNHGDYQLMEYLSGLLEPSMGQIYYETRLNNTNVLYNLIFNQPYNPADLEFQMEAHYWKMEDRFQLAVIHLAEDNGETTLPDENLNRIQSIILQQVSGTHIMQGNGCVLLLANRELSKDTAFDALLKSLASSNPIVTGFSLFCQGISCIKYLHEQAEYAVSRGSTKHPEKTSFDFYDYAVDYIIESGTRELQVNACMPEIAALWELYQKNDDQLFQTLKYYLDYDCSVSRASAALYTHRNTVLYRIRKIKEFLQDELEDVYVKKYCRLSVDTLELYGKKQKTD